MSLLEQERRWVIRLISDLCWSRRVGTEHGGQNNAPGLTNPFLAKYRLGVVSGLQLIIGHSRASEGCPGLRYMVRWVSTFRNKKSISQSRHFNLATCAPRHQSAHQAARRTFFLFARFYSGSYLMQPCSLLVSSWPRQISSQDSTHNDQIIPQDFIPGYCSPSATSSNPDRCRSPMLDSRRIWQARLQGMQGRHRPGHPNPRP